MSRVLLVLLFCCAAVLAAATDEPSRRALKQRGGGDGDGDEGNNRCTEPPEGVYLLEHNVPTERGNDTLVLQAMNLLSLRKGDVPDFYIGTAGGVAFNSMIPLIPAGSPIAVNFVGLFDRETCIISGALYIDDFVDPVHWFYDGETITGDYVNTLNNTELFTARSRAVLTPTF